MPRYSTRRRALFLAQGERFLARASSLPLQRLQFLLGDVHSSEQQKRQKLRAFSSAADASAYAADAAPGGFSIARTGRNAVFGMFVGGPLLSLWFRTLHIVARSSRVTYEPLLPALAWFGARFPAAAASLDRVPLLGG